MNDKAQRLMLKMSLLHIFCGTDITFTFPGGKIFLKQSILDSSKIWYNKEPCSSPIKPRKLNASR